MVITPFGDLDFGSESGLQNWMDAHDQQHQMERQAIAFQGIPLYPRSFQAPLTTEWYGNHMAEHRTLINFAVPDDTISATLIEMSWDTEDNFYKWHQIHNQLHQRLDQALGINSTTGGTLGATTAGSAS